jgi:ubiquinone/menaquinone biosynthesis C-methylase UbiE
MNTQAEFYDKVAKKFGKYHTGAKYIQQFDDGEPEKIFKQKLIELSGKNKIALDLGCGDGRFILSLSDYFKKIIGIDVSEKMLAAARALKKEKNIQNVEFYKQNASATTFNDSSFDFIYSRRGPTPFDEIHRLLKKNGYFIDINIGEQDCRELKEIFNRGQDFGQWVNSRLKIIENKTNKIGFKTIFARNYFYQEYYPNYQELDLFLQGVPIFKDYDSDEDLPYLKEYIEKHKTKKGIKLNRHRIVIVLQK